MRFASNLIVSAMTLIIGMPTAAAQLYYNAQPGQTTTVINPSQTNPSPAAEAGTSTSTSPPRYYDSEIPNGPLTVGQFIDAVSSRLYTTDMQDACFSDLVGTLGADYDLLFADVSVTQPIALSVCTMMKSGLVRGSSNMLRPNKLLTAAEAATLLTRLSVVVRDARTNEAWYGRYMESMRSLDPQFTYQPGDIITGLQLRNTLCILKRTTPQLDPMGEFTNCR